MAELRSADAILFGAITTPPDPDYRSAVLQIRHDLDLYANVRPIQGGDVDIVIVRENTEGLYSGIEWTEPDRACTVRVVTRRGSERVARYACTLAKSRRHLTVGNKANVLKSDCLFVEVCMAEAARANVPCTARYIDALCLDVLMHPDRYDVIVTTNIFGDILSDAAAYLVGGLGMLPSANIGERHALFEPVHGSAPDIAGQNSKPHRGDQERRDAASPCRRPCFGGGRRRGCPPGGGCGRPDPGPRRHRRDPGVRGGGAPGGGAEEGAERI